MSTLTRQGQKKLKEWIALLNRDGWSKPDKQYLVDYWLEHHDEDGVVIAKGHPFYVQRDDISRGPGQSSGDGD